MATKPTTNEQGPIEIAALSVDTLVAYIVGSSDGIILNQMAEKARQELLMPKGRKTAADKAASLKHNPLEEFRSAPYRMREANAPTVLAFPATGIKSAIRDAALCVPGAKKAEIGRLTWVNGELLPLYGVPELLMRIVRNSDMNRTPDVRTRVIVPKWAIEVKISFVTSMIRATAIANLLAAGGLTIGIGDWRQGKGSSNYGQFRVCDAKDPELIKIMKQGRAAQAKALEKPVMYDEQTEKLMSWFNGECRRRGAKV